MPTLQARSVNFYDQVGFLPVGVAMTPGGMPAARLRLEVMVEPSGG